MAWEKEMVTITAPTAVDLSAKQYCFVKRTAGLIVPVAAVTDRPLGVLQNKPVGSATQHDAATVCLYGITKLVSSVALTQDAGVGPAADGRGEAKVAGVDATEFLCGTMLTTTSGANAIGTAAINCMNPPLAVTGN